MISKSLLYCLNKFYLILLCHLHSQKKTRYTHTGEISRIGLQYYKRKIHYFSKLQIYQLPLQKSVFDTAQMRYHEQNTNGSTMDALNQDCALTTPCRRRRLTFGLRQPKIYSWSPGRPAVSFSIYSQEAKRKRCSIGRVLIFKGRST